jgi:hypothetical protein
MSLPALLLSALEFLFSLGLAIVAELVGVEHSARVESGFFSLVVIIKSELFSFFFALGMLSKGGESLAWWGAAAFGEIRS